MALFSLGYMPSLETDRLLLRRLTMRDAEDIFAYSKDPEVARHVLWSAHRSIGESRAYIRYMMRRYRMTEPASWGIERLDQHRVIGTIGFMNIDDANWCAEVGYSLARSCWGQGYMTEALTAVLEYGFHALNLHRIEAMHEPDNPASGAVMRKCGMQREGLLRGKLLNKGHYVDVEVYGILREDFMER